MSEKGMREAAIEQFTEAVSLYHQGRKEEAERAFRKTVEEYPNELDVVHRARQYMQWFTSQPPVPEEENEDAPEPALPGQTVIDCPVCNSQLVIGDGVLRVWCQQCEDYINVDPDYGPVGPMERLYELMRRDGESAG